MNGDIRIVHFPELSSSWEAFKSACKKAKELDSHECEVGKRWAHWYGEGMFKDFGALLELRDKYVRELDAALAALGAQVSTFQQSDVMDALRTKRDGWLAMQKQTAEIATDVTRHHRTDRWEGEAAQSYRNTLPTQIKALQELAGLAHSQGTACDQLGQINAYLFLNTLNAISSATSKLDLTPAQIDESHEQINGVGVASHRYLSRVLTATAYATQIDSWLTRQRVVSTADWGGAAVVLDTQLIKAMSSPSNLQPHGKWPGIGHVIGSQATDTSVAGRGNGFNLSDAELSDPGASVGW